MAVAYATFGKEFLALMLRVVMVRTVVTPVETKPERLMLKRAEECFSLPSRLDWSVSTGNSLCSSFGHSAADASNPEMLQRYAEDQRNWCHNWAQPWLTPTGLCSKPTISTFGQKHFLHLLAGVEA